MTPVCHWREFTWKVPHRYFSPSLSLSLFWNVVKSALSFLPQRWAAGRDSWAYFHLPNTRTALGPPCSSLIIHIQARASWQVCWSHSMFCDLDNTFSLCGQKMLRPSDYLRPVLWDSTEAEALNHSSSVRVFRSSVDLPDPDESDAAVKIPCFYTNTFFEI